MRLVIERGWLRIVGASSEVRALIESVVPKSFDSNGALKVSAMHYPTVVELLDSHHIPYERRYALPIPPGFRLEGMDEVTKLPLHPFQIEGASFLVHARQAVLADAVGLGKTVQTLAACAYLSKQGKLQRALVLVPSAIKLQWGDETARFTDLPYLVIHGDKEERMALWEQALAEDFRGLVIANWELLHHDTDAMVAYAERCEAIILDEAERIRNYKTKTSKLLRDLTPPYRWALTATPLQVRVEELYSIMRWVDPFCFGFRPKEFLSRYCVRNKFGQVVAPRTPMLPELQARVAPYILRRTEEDVQTQLPAIQEERVRVYMTAAQTQLHQKIKASLLDLLDQRDRLAVAADQDLSDEQRARLHARNEYLSQAILGRLALLKMVASHPAALLDSESDYVKELLEGVDPSALATAPKLDWLLHLLYEEPDAQVVVFSEFARVASLIYDALVANKISAVFESGETSDRERKAAQDLFQIGAARVFVSTDAGSRGINLQRGQIVVHFDLPWNPATLTQRDGRIRRIGSAHRRVRSIRLLSAASIDEQVDSRIYERREMFDLLVEQPARVRSALSRQALRKLLGA